MVQYKHLLSGIFQQHDDAVLVRLKLKENGLPLERMQIIEKDFSVPMRTTQGQSNEVLKNMVVQGSAGTLIGLGLGAFAEIALVATDVTPFVASSLIAPLVMLGWGASIGATVGAIIGATKQDDDHSIDKEGGFSGLISDAIASNQVELVVETSNKKETAIAAEVMKLSVNNFKDMKLA
jgi:hypothetical protein